MHISDLHRCDQNPVTNEELLSSLLADAARLRTESPPISQPSAIVVSGDLVRGLPLGDQGYPQALAAQYDQAQDFLTRLAAEFLAGDNGKVVIVPGNHDIDWNLGRTAMEPASTKGQDMPTLLAMPRTPYRWSWQDLRLYRITSEEEYCHRFRFFCEMYTRFYSGAMTLALPVDPWRPWNLFSFDDGRIIICAFNSCSRNDCYSRIGLIAPDAIAQGHLQVLAMPIEPSIRLAIWHHDIEGSPSRNDYMDSDTVKVMIDRGYCMGLHGHRHRSEAAPYSIFTSEEFSMPVISAGSLCSSGVDLPSGVRRQYNIIEFDDAAPRARVHVREMQRIGAFGRGRLDSAGGRSYADVEWKPVPSGRSMGTPLTRREELALAEEVERLLASGDPHGAIAAVDRSPVVTSPYLRRLLINSLDRAEQWPRLITVVGEPHTTEEVTLLVKAMIKLRQWPQAEEQLTATGRSALCDATTLRTLRQWVTAERAIAP